MSYKEHLLLFLYKYSDTARDSKFVNTSLVFLSVVWTQTLKQQMLCHFPVQYFERSANKPYVKASEIRLDSC